jgi:periplasmic copper chaperone A
LRARHGVRAAEEIRMQTPLTLATVCLVLSGCGASAHAQPPALSAQDAWIRATPGSDVAAAYLTLHNGGTQTLVVVGVRSPRAQMAMIHETKVVNGRSRMEPREPLSVRAGETLRFAPGGLHIMLHGLTHPLAPGEEVPLVLLLKGDASIAVTARVRPLGSD